MGLRLVLGAEAETCVYHAQAYQGLALPRLTQELEQTGLVGRMHGAAVANQSFVLSVRDPQNFFSHAEFSLIPDNASVRTALSRLHRHDQVCIQGKFIENPSPQKHLVVKAVQLQDTWTSPEATTLGEWKAELPAPLSNRPPNQRHFVGKVHAIGAGGKVLVVESQDQILPIYVAVPDETQGLYRGDIVRIHYQLQKRPHQPTHLQLDQRAKQPLEVLDAIATWHGKTQTLTGKLVKFPQSPQIKLDVYAIEVETLGIKRTFTLVNLSNPEIFQQIQAKMAEIWDKNVKTASAGRNQFINPNVAIAATGQINVVSTEQANPQILLDSVESIQIQDAPVKRA